MTIFVGHELPIPDFSITPPSFLPSTSVEMTKWLLEKRLFLWYTDPLLTLIFLALYARKPRIQSRRTLQTSCP
jgi:hypothetical protein